VTAEERKTLLADEWLIVRNSGEIPEITFHSTLHYLQEASDGPELVLIEEELRALKDAAIQRYHEIILRDLDINNFHQSVYRGVKRALYNQKRCEAFMERQAILEKDFQKIAAQTLVLFLKQGAAVAGKTLPDVFINCSMAELIELAGEFEVTVEAFPVGIERFCLQSITS